MRTQWKRQTKQNPALSVENHMGHFIETEQKWKKDTEKDITKICRPKGVLFQLLIPYHVKPIVGSSLVIIWHFYVFSQKDSMEKQ